MLREATHERFSIEGTCIERDRGAGLGGGQNLEGAYTEGA